MSKELQSQWQFGELFPLQEIKKVYSVAQLTLSIKRLLENELQSVWVAGEISNLRIQTSGHVYFSLKDNSAQLSCVLFRGDLAGLNRDLLADGKKVVVGGEITVYEARGQYQLIVSDIQLQGQGALQAAFEKLKLKLHAEGLFRDESKKPLPRFPRRVGIVTSITGAALQDVLHVLNHRCNCLKLVLVDCRVQGQGAAEQIVCAIELFNQWPTLPRGKQVDLILLTRGGGSIEDLWAFNEEIVARAIFASNIPIISAVGHEIDFTISDFVADFRAATPSAAAEIITEGYFSHRKIVADQARRLRQLVTELILTRQEGLALLISRLARTHPRRGLQQQMQRLDDLSRELQRAIAARLQACKQQFEYISGRHARMRPSQLLLRRKADLGQTNSRLRKSIRNLMERKFAALQHAKLRLDLLSPLSVLKRGYSITFLEETGEVVKSASQVGDRATLKTKLHQGELRSTVAD